MAEFSLIDGPIAGQTSKQARERRTGRRTNEPMREQNKQDGEERQTSWHEVRQTSRQKKTHRQRCIDRRTNKLARGGTEPTERERERDTKKGVSDRRAASSIDIQTDLTADVHRLVERQT